MKWNCFWKKYQNEKHVKLLYFNQFPVPNSTESFKTEYLLTSTFENSKLVTLTYFLNSFVYKKSGAEVYKFFGFYGFAKSDLVYEMAFNSCFCFIFWKYDGADLDFLSVRVITPPLMINPFFFSHRFFFLSFHLSCTVWKNGSLE